MRVSRLFGKTLRDDPAEAELASHRLMLRAGMIYQVASGIYSYMPLAWRSLRKIEQIIREEMDAVGGQEVRMPVIQPQELWDESGRTDIMGPSLFRLKDRRGRPLVLAPTHEEVLTGMVKANVNSYRDLPLVVYQIQTKFRDETRPRGGLIRVREFDMKDAYSFDADDEGLDKSYNSMIKAYNNIYRRCGLDVVMVEADSGAIGGKDSHEFILLADAGEDTIIICPQSHYYANAEKAVFQKPEQTPEDPLELEEVHTPGVKTIAELAEFLDVPTSKTLKAVFYSADGEVVFVVIRGDLEVNEVKLNNALGGVAELRLATPDEVRAKGLVAGSASPIGLDGIRIIADDSINMGSNFVVGANRQDYHLRNSNHPRDFKADVITDIALAEEGFGCPLCGEPLTTRRGIEVGHVFKLGTRYSEVAGAYFPDQNDVQRPIIMGCYGIGVGRLLGAAIEQHHDDKGMILPTPLAPYDVSLIGLNVENPDVANAAEDLYGRLTQAGIDVLYDDRSESPGVKFNDADLLGLPVRLVVSPRNLKQNVVEVKRRSQSEAVTVPPDEVVAKVRELLES
ncbi:MAG: proline--tRNA ligase [Chloroflexi bacterium]|nr:proline--tRNA ligase [Chloroflexota bacterium]